MSTSWRVSIMIMLVLVMMTRVTIMAMITMMTMAMAATIEVIDDYPSFATKDFYSTWMVASYWSIINHHNVVKWAGE